MKIALFGGSFDPPHAGHDAAVKAILSGLKPDLLVIMPSFLNPFKKSFSAPPQLRLRWCRALWSDAPHVEVSDYEISQNRPVPTIQSVKFLLEKYGASGKITSETAGGTGETPTAVTDRALPNGANIANKISAGAHILGSAGKILPGKADRVLSYGIAKISSDDACTADITDGTSIPANAKNEALQGGIADQISIGSKSEMDGISQSNAGSEDGASKIQNADKISNASEILNAKNREIPSSIASESSDADEISGANKIPSGSVNDVRNVSGSANETNGMGRANNVSSASKANDNANGANDTNGAGQANNVSDASGISDINDTNDAHSAGNAVNCIGSASGTDTIPKLYIVVGADNLSELHKWRNFSELQKLAEFVVLTRPGYEIPRQWASLRRIEIAVDASSSGFRRDFKGEIPPKIAAEVIKFYKRKDMQDPKQRAERIAEILNEKKAEDVQIIDMEGREYIAKFVVIATMLTARHAASLIEELKSVLKPLGEEFLAIESGDEWSVVDLGDIIVHLISETYRAKYNIEDFLDKLKKEQF
ncbi:ribosome silencing factor [uncultured Campylobacter sp.]|uniref:ribosome silencing factor n=1 Tax=uncultured Campylobacter sp. TaxID=218934 RepID=UPI00262A79F6|nr:ribosome silencing factor [uncultured Campylobacter sp.]